jgi:hypothetical protein
MPIPSDAFYAYGGSINANFIAERKHGGPTYGYYTSYKGNDPQFPIGGSFGGRYFGVYGFAGQGQDNGKKFGPDQNSYSWKAGVFGTSIEWTGVAGTSQGGVGVYGQNTGGEAPDALQAGVLGVGTQGVIGFSTYADGTGVQGFSDSTGVMGFGGRTLAEGGGIAGVGVGGVGNISGVIGVGSGYGVLGISGHFGPGIPGSLGAAGLFGTSDTQIGVMGSSSAFWGVAGYSPNSIGVVGMSASPPSGPDNWAGYFAGNVNVTNDLHVAGQIFAGTKDAIVPFPDGSKRLLHCMESPEHWFEDFGTAKLARGRAVVKLDTNFAKIIKSGDYRVFVTPEGDCAGLYVRRKRPASFEVRELMAGRSSVAFCYRIVGRRKDIKAHQRFAKIDAHLPLPVAQPTRTPTAAALRAFIARVEKEARERAPKRAKRGRRPRVHPLPRPLVKLPPLP